MTGQDKSWGGIFPSLCTPFAQDGALDLVCFGLAGEVNKLTPEECKRLAAVILEEVDGHVPVLLGVGTETLHTSIELARYAETAGASGIVIPPPLTAHLPSDDLGPYFCAIAAATALPVVIQDAPANLNVGLSSACIRQCAQTQPNIRCMKVETGPEGTAPLGDRHRLRGSLAAAEALFRRLLVYLAFSLQDLDHYNSCTKEMLVRRGILSRAGLREPAPRLSTLGLDLLNGHSAKLELSAPAPGLPVMP